MLTQPQVQRFTTESGLRDIMIAEKEVILTYLLQLLAERGVLKKLAFKGGTCLRKMHLGSQGRFSTDLDFTSVAEHDHEDIIIEMMEAFEQPFHGITFKIAMDKYYEADGGASWGANPTYTHGWNPSGQSEVKFQVSKRETPTLPTKALPQQPQGYFKHLPFSPTEIVSLALDEVISEKIRACYQRNKARDIYDLGIFATRPLDKALIRRLVVLKLWQVGDTFDPQRFIDKLAKGDAFDWDDLQSLMGKGQKVDRAKTTSQCAAGYAFLSNLAAEERTLAGDGHKREHKLWERLRSEIQK